MAKHSIVHVEIPASDPKEAAKFYSDLFGWNTEAAQTGAGEYWMFRPDAQPGGGFNPVGEGGPWPVKPGDVFLYISTDDIDATLAKVESLGGRVLMSKTEIPNIGWFGIFTDPTGNQMALYTSMHRRDG